GADFRAFCDSCSRQDTKQIVDRAPRVRQAAHKLYHLERDSTLWLGTAHLIAQHIMTLADAAVERHHAAANPSLHLATSLVKVDLSCPDTESGFWCRVVNKGSGQAYKVHVST